MEWCVRFAQLACFFFSLTEAVGEQDRKRVGVKNSVIDRDRRLTRGTGDDDTWSIVWNPEGSEAVNFTLVRWLDMNYGDLDAFQHGFNECLKKRLDSPGAKPVSEALVPMDDADTTATPVD